MNEFPSDLYSNHNQVLSIVVHLLALFPLFGFRGVLRLVVRILKTKAEKYPEELVPSKILNENRFDALDVRLDVRDVVAVMAVEEEFRFRSVSV